MNRRDSHVPHDRLAALAIAPVSDPMGDDDRAALEHVTACDTCSLALASLTVSVEELREEAHREADAIFAESALAEQRRRILERIAHLGHAARVLAFPASRRPMPLSTAPHGRRWVSVAAAAGLIIGLVAGQMLHFLPGDVTHRTAAVEPQARAVPGIVPASVTTTTLSDEEVLTAIEESAEIRALELRALDELTPVLTEIP